MSSKFEDWWNMHNCVKESLMREDARYVYESRQAEVDELQKKYNAMYNAFVVADDCRQEWHRCYVGVRQREDELQKLIDEAWMWCEKGCVLKAMEILKGEETK